MKNVAVLALSLVATTIAAHAAPISGQFSIVGTSVQNTGSALTFNPTDIAVGAANTITGSFNSILTAGEAGSISPTINYSNYTPGSASFYLSNGSTNLTYTLSSIDMVSNGIFSNFIGQGTFTTNVAGFDSTPGTLLFSTQGNGSVTFSATANASPVPEPSSLALIGTGIVGAAGAIRRKLARA